MNKNSILITSMFLIFITSCSIQTTSKKTKEIDVRVGFNGLVLEFVKNTPPLKVFEGDIFPVIIKVMNRGAYSIENDKAILSLSIEKDYTRDIQLQTTNRVKRVALDDKSDKLSDKPAMFGLEGKTPVNQNGNFEVISYNLQAGKVDPQSEAHSSTVIATVCYPYQTVLSTTVCIDTDISNTRPGKKVCKMGDIIFGNGQGAPVAITKIEVNMLPTQVNEQTGDQKIKPQFLIFIENKDKGDVIKSGFEKEYCTNSRFLHENLNKIFVSASLGGKELDCTTLKKDPNNPKDNYVKLLDKKALARCIVKDTDEDKISRTEDTYLSPLKVELTYGYTQSILGNYFIQKTTVK